MCVGFILCYQSLSNLSFSVVNKEHCGCHLSHSTMSHFINTYRGCQTAWDAVVHLFDFFFRFYLCSCIVVYFTLYSTLHTVLWPSMLRVSMPPKNTICSQKDWQLTRNEWLVEFSFSTWSVVYVIGQLFMYLQTLQSAVDFTAQQNRDQMSTAVLNMIWDIWRSVAAGLTEKC